MLFMTAALLALSTVAASYDMCFLNFGSGDCEGADTICCNDLPEGACCGSTANVDQYVKFAVYPGQESEFTLYIFPQSATCDNTFYHDACGPPGCCISVGSGNGVGVSAHYLSGYNSKRSTDASGSNIDAKCMQPNQASFTDDSGSKVIVQIPEGSYEDFLPHWIEGNATAMAMYPVWEE